jgi:hypothetical protein
LYRCARARSKTSGPRRRNRSTMGGTTASDILIPDQRGENHRECAEFEVSSRHARTRASLLTQLNREPGIGTVFCCSPAAITP